MIRLLKIYSIPFIVALAYCALTPRELELAFVNATSQEQLEVEYSIDKQAPIKKTLEQATIPHEWISSKVRFGFHQLQVTSQDCQVSQSIRFFNFYYVNIILEFQGGEVCETLVRKSILPKFYQ